MRRYLMLLLVLLLVACGGDDDESSRRDTTPFYTATPEPSATPRPTSTAAAPAVALTNNFSRIDGAIRIQYPDGWVIETDGDAIQGVLTLGNNRAAERGNPTRPDDLSLRLTWGPATELVDAVVEPDIGPSALLRRLLVEQEDREGFSEPVTIALGDRQVAQVERDDEARFVVDFGAGVAGYYVFKTGGEIVRFDEIMLALIESTRYGGPPAIVESDARRDPVLSVTHDDAVTGAIWMADGTQVLTWSNDSTIRRWDAATGEELMLYQHSVRLRQVELSHDGTRLVAMAEGQPIRIWDVATGELLFTLEALGTIESFAWSPDEQYVVGLVLNYASGSSNAPVWDVTTGEVVAPLRPEIGETAVGAAWDDDSMQVVLYGSGGGVPVWDITEGERLMVLVHNGDMNGAWWHDDRITTTSQDGYTRVWDSTNGELALRLMHDTAPPLGVRWSMDRSRLLTWQRDRFWQVWDADSGDLLLEGENPPALGGAAWSASETRLITWAHPSSEVPLVRIWDAVTGELQFEAVGQRVLGNHAWNPRETLLVTWGDDGIIKVWNMNTTVVAFSMEHEDVSGVRWSPDGEWLVSWSTDGTVNIWDGMASSGE